MSAAGWDRHRARPGAEDAPSAVALVHDYLLVLRGAERTFAAIADCWPKAPIATLLYDQRGTHGRFGGRTITTSALQALPVRQRGFRAMLPLFPLAVETLRIADARLVISSSSAFAHGVRCPADAIHVCYCHSPFRYVYHDLAWAIREAPPSLRPAVKKVLTLVRHWQKRAAQRPTAYIANSQITRRRIQDVWGRDATVIHPPVDVERFYHAEPEDYFLVVSELVPHKRVEMALEAARLVRRPVAVVGDGPYRRHLEARYGQIATFHGRVSDERLAELYARALALVVPNVEEFGIAAVEAQAAGRPVIGLEAGGTAETVIPGQTGVLVATQEPRSFAEAMAGTDFRRFDVDRIRGNAERFTRCEFQRKLREEVQRIAGLEPSGPGAPESDAEHDTYSLPTR